MNTMNRRTFIGKTAAAFGAATFGGKLFGAEPGGAATTTRPAAGALAAADTVTLGKTGIRTSRLSMGTGTRGGSKQRELGIDGMVRLFRHGLDEGVRWWDVADMYRTHPHVAATLKEIQRDKVVITSKTTAKTAEGVRADLERFRSEMDTDYIDIVLLHCMEDPEWPSKMKGPMDVLSEAKEKGWVRAVGCSCHTFGALQAAADEPWVEVDLARFNPFATIMDVGKKEEVPRVARVLETMHQRGKAVYGMKIIGEGAFKGEQIDESLRFALSHSFISGFTIGFTSQEELDDLIRRIDRLRVRA
jgi:1-deoxyxylulose-5-phosphate synthase